MSMQGSRVSSGSVKVQERKYIGEKMPIVKREDQSDIFSTHFKEVAQGKTEVKTEHEDTEMSEGSVESRMRTKCFNYQVDPRGLNLFKEFKVVITSSI